MTYRGVAWSGGQHRSLPIQGSRSSLVCADSCLNFHFSYTRACYMGFLLRHYSFSYLIVSQKTYTRDRGTICAGRGNNFYSLSLRKTFFTQHFESIFPPVQSHCTVNQYIGKKVCSILYCLKVDVFFTTANDREKAARKTRV